MDTRNTALIKNASEILETNALNKPLTKVNQTLQPIVKIEPYINVVESVVDSAVSNQTLFTTPTDKDFYLTNLSLTVADNTGVFNSSTVAFVLADGNNRSISCSAVAYDTGLGYTIPTSNSTDIVFPLRGVLLQKGSLVRYSFDAQGSLTVAGYTSSNRSGL